MTTRRSNYKLGTNSGTFISVTREELLASQKWSYLDSEFARRVIAIIDLAIAHNKMANVGTTYRSYDDQVREFRKRYRGVKSRFRDSISWDGTDSSGTVYKYWVKKDKNTASMAPPGATYHDLVTNEKKCLAIDLMGFREDRAFLRSAAPLFGLYMTTDPTDPHHFQPIEVPLNKKLYNPNVHKLSKFTFNI